MPSSSLVKIEVGVWVEVELIKNMPEKMGIKANVSQSGS